MRGKTLVLGQWELGGIGCENGFSQLILNFLMRDLLFLQG